MVAPVAVKVTAVPVQIKVLLLEALTVGELTTVTVLTAVFELTQPAVLVPVTEYCVVEVGLTTVKPPVMV